jgi:ATP-dependent DNA helicase DinG
VADAASVLGGKTLVLTTTLAAMRAIGHALKQHFAGLDTFVVLVQGDGPKQDLISRFAQTGAGRVKGCILIGSASFWEGIDLAGEALQMVVIDKLPFAPPGDPLIEARAKVLTDSGKAPFQSLHLPHAAVALKQGAGRLIRRESDRGVLVVCDVRLKQMGYGRRLISALPPMRLLESSGQFYELLDSLTKPSTKDPHLP